MRRIEEWVEKRESYNLNDGFMLKRADKKEYGIHEAIYSGVDVELSFSWKNQTDDKTDSEDHFWIIKDEIRIGGVHIEPNLMGSFFMEAPYHVDRFRVIKEINKALVEWSSNDKDIRVYGVTPRDIESYQKLGYKIKCERRVMIRPTEHFENVSFGEGLTIKTATLDHGDELGKLFYESYKDGVDYEIFGDHNLQEATDDAKGILKIYSENNTLEGSILLYDENSGELVGACIAGINGFCDNDFSEIGELVVKPSYRGRGIATNLIKESLTRLKKISPATILCVTIGNHAESVYHNMGFYSGVKFSHMILRK